MVLADEAVARKSTGAGAEAAAAAREGKVVGQAPRWLRAEGPRLAVDRQGEGAAPPLLQVPVPQ